MTDGPRRPTAIRAFLFHLVQWTWGLPANLAGALLHLVLRLRGGRPGRFRHARVLWIRGPFIRGMCLGEFLFLEGPDPEPPLPGTVRQALLVHEYGHACQVLLLGPLFPFLVGIPSMLWAGLPAFRRLRARRGIPYDRLYCEAWATAWGRRFAADSKPAVHSPSA